jgi:hypothetical protein
MSVAGAAMVAMTACESEPKPSATATLFNNDAVHAAFKALVDAVDALDGGVSRFDSENWRDVVPDIRAAAAKCGWCHGWVEESPRLLVSWSGGKEP